MTKSRYIYVKVIADTDKWVRMSGAVIGEIYKAESRESTSGGILVHVQENENHYYIQKDCLEIVPKPDHWGEAVGWETP